MHTIELLEEAIALATRSGIGVRQDWFGGSPAGLCELKGRRFVFVDLSLSPREQLEQILEGLRNFGEFADPQPSPRLCNLLNRRKAA
jgi:hypothetical protein